MADKKQLKQIKESVEVWNRWRKDNYQVAINLSVANLYRATLSGADLKGANLAEANLYKADLSHTDLEGANLRGAYLVDANLIGAKLSKAILASATLSNATLFSADLSEADLSGADLTGVNLAYANLRSANLTEAKLRNVSLVGTDINHAILKGCKIFGLSAWALKGVPKEQSSLIITDNGEPEITVDDLQVGQFIYLLLNNKNVRNVIDTITSKAVLILGRFTEERKAILDTLQARLRKRNYLPILFDFSGPENRDITETVSTLAHMARFIIADITDAKSIPQELQAIVPNLPSVPIQPILLASQDEYGMFEHFKRYPWVLPTFYYKDTSDLITSISQTILDPLEDKFLKMNK